MSTTDRAPRRELAELLETHPLRSRILELVEQRGQAAPVDLAGVLDAPLGTIAYHVRVLLAAGALELVEERRVRGAVAHYYRVTAGGQAAHVDTPLEVAVTALERILADDAGATVASAYAEVALERLGRKPSSVAA